MDCSQFRELIAGAVDHCITQEELEQFTAHAQECLACRREFEVEAATKALVHDRMGMVSTPASLLAAIARGLNAEGGRGRASWFRGLLSSSRAKAALAFSLAFAAITLILILPRQHDQSFRSGLAQGQDVILHSFSTFKALLNGDLRPRLVSDRPESLRVYFAGKTEFPVLLPPMKDCILVGGDVERTAGATLAHVVYRRGKNLIYVCQACWDVVQQGEKLRLDDAARDELRRSGWFSRAQPDGDTIVLWTRGETMCAAVAHMPKEDLVACLSSPDSAAASGVEEW